MGKESRRKRTLKRNINRKSKKGGNLRKKKENTIDPLLVQAARIVIAADKSGFPMGDYSTWTGDYNAGHPDVIKWQETNYAKSSGDKAKASDAIEKEFCDDFKGYPSTQGTNKAVKNAIARRAIREARKYYALYEDGELGNLDPEKEVIKTSNIVYKVASVFDDVNQVPDQLEAACVVLDKFSDFFSSKIKE